MVEEKSKQAAGDKQGRKPWTLIEVGGKTIWEWMQLFIMPLALAVIGFYFSMQQDARQHRARPKPAHPP